MQFLSKLFFFFCIIQSPFFSRAQDSIHEKPLLNEFKELAKYNTPIEYKFDSITVYAICTGYISTNKKYPEPVFVWLIKTPIGNYLIDGGLSPNITDPDYFKGISKTVFNHQFDFYIYKTNNLTTQLEKLGVSKNLKSIILTHGHFDHIGYLNSLNKVPVIISLTEKDQIETFGQAMGYEKGTENQIDFKRCEVIKLGDNEIKTLNKYISIIKTGHHTKGHMMILVNSGKTKLLFTGDINLNSLPHDNEIYKFIDAKFKISTLKLFFNHDQKL